MLKRPATAILNGWGAVVGLYRIQVLLILALVFAAGQQQLLTKEEASSTFVNPVFLQLRLQHHLYGTNFYAYAFWGGAGALIPGLFYGRFAMAAVMALLPPIVHLYLRRRFSWPGSQAFLAAIAIGLLPGVIGFSWIGVEYGLPAPVGFLALWLALFESPLAIAGSCFAAALAAGTYGSGLVFLPVVFFHQLPRLRKPELRHSVIAGGALAAAVLLFPVFWWTNVQTLFVGGAGVPSVEGGFDRLADLFRELFVHSGSYYFFTNGTPALGSVVIGMAALAGMAVMMIREPSRSWPVFMVSAVTLALYAPAGNVPGVRRTIPLVVSLGICAAVLLRIATAGGPVRRVVFYGLLSAAILFEFAKYNGIRRGLASSEIPLPHDFEFRIPPGETMSTAIAALVNRSRTLPDDLAGYEPDRTLAILYRLTLPNPIVTADELVARCDRHGWSIPSGSRRLSRLRHWLCIACPE